jgi:hypothetical protein
MSTGLINTNTQMIYSDYVWQVPISISVLQCPMLFFLFTLVVFPIANCLYLSVCGTQTAPFEIANCRQVVFGHLQVGLF